MYIGVTYGVEPKYSVVTPDINTCSYFTATAVLYVLVAVLIDINCKVALYSYIRIMRLELFLLHIL